MRQRFLGILTLTVTLLAVAGCDRKDSDTRSGGDGSFTPLLWDGQPLTPPTPPPPPPPPPPTSTDLMTFEDYDPTWYAGNLDPLRTATTDPVVTGPEDQLFALINTHRVGMALNALVHDNATREVARAHVKHMTIHVPPFFSSDSPELTPPSWDINTPPVTFLERLDWNFVFFPVGAGETLVAGPGMTAGQAFTAMLANPTFQMVIEDPLWTEVGIGYWPGGPSGDSFECIFK